MSDQSHLDEMNAAIRAQRERHAVPRSMVDETPGQHDEPPSVREPEPDPARRLLARLLGR